MAVKRIPLAQTISSRNSTTQKDALIYNGFAEKEADGTAYVVRRFGYALYQQISAAATALGIYNFNGLPVSIIGTTFYSGNLPIGTVDSNSKYQFVAAVLGGGMLAVKNNTAAYLWNGTVLKGIPNAAQGNTIYEVTATGFGSGYTHATVTIADSTGVGAVITPVITGGQILSYTIVYPGTFYTAPTLTVTGDGTGATATAVLQPNGYPAATVPGIAYLDGYLFVLDATGKVWNSDLNQPFAWNPLGFVTGSASPDIGVRIARYASYIVSFCQNSLMFLYDAATTPPASPLAPYVSAIVNVGCASADSVVETENNVFWVGQTKQKGRSVYTFAGLGVKTISNQYIDRILNADTLAHVYSYFLKIDGHAFYILTLVDSNITLVYDAVTGEWARWTSTTLSATTLTPTTITVDPISGLVTLTVLNHNLTNPTIVNISGGIPAQYKGDHLINVIDQNTITYTQTGTFVSGINTDTINSFAIDAESIVSTVQFVPAASNFIVTPYLNNYFRAVFYTDVNGHDLLLDQTSGALYTITEDITDDFGKYIFNSIITQATDFGANTRKFCASAEIIGDKINDMAYLGYSDNDYQNYGNFRPIALGANRAQVRKLSWFRRRAHQIVYFGSYNMRFYGLDLDLDQGEQ